MIQPSSAAEVAIIVLVNAVEARSPAVSAEPALKPNQPNHSRLAPSRVNGRLWGRMGSFGQPRRRPATRQRARPAAPALMCTAVPPAKSSAPSLLGLAIQPPTASGETKPSNENTQCATGKYTTVAHRTMNRHQLQNLMRSAIAPEISAGVITANISWNMQNASSGIASGPGHGTGLSPVTAKPARWPTVLASPTNSPPPSSPPPMSLPNDRLKPYSAHSTPTMPSATKFIISMFRTLLLRTMPP